MKKQKNKITMKELTNGYEKFIKGKEVRKDSKKAFEKVIKEAVKKNVKS
jgi:hypothetical protein